MADPSPLVLPEDPQKQLHLLAFYDFCLDLFEEEFGKIPPEEKVDPRFVKGLHHSFLRPLPFLSLILNYS